MLSLCSGSKEFVRQVWLSLRCEDVCAIVREEGRPPDVDQVL